MKRAVLFLPLLLTACEMINTFAEDAGSHLPVADERCEYWQCITEYGKTRSNEIKHERIEAAKNASKIADDIIKKDNTKNPAEKTAETTTDK